MNFTSLKKAKHYKSTKLFFNFLKLLVLFFLGAYGQQAFASQKCDESNAALYGRYRICVSSNVDTLGYGDTLILTGWTETPCYPGSLSFCPDPYLSIGFVNGIGTAYNRYGANTSPAKLTKYFQPGQSYDNGQFTLKLGQNSVRAATFYGRSPELIITVTEQRTSVNLTTTKAKVKVGEQFTLNSETYAYFATGTSYIYVTAPDGTFLTLYNEAQTESNYGWRLGFPLSLPLVGKYIFQGQFLTTSENYYSSTSAPLEINVEAADSTNTLTISPSSPISAGRYVTLTSTLGGASGQRTGTVDFYDGATWLGRAYVINNVASVSTFALKTVGMHALRAEYSGDTHFATSISSNVNVDVTFAKSSVNLSSSLAKAPLGQAITLTANVAGVSATGTVQFFDGSTLLGTSNLTNGVASINLPSMQTVGDHSITAVYSGDTNNLGSTSSALTQTIVRGNSVVALTASTQTPATPGSLVILMANLSGDGTGRTGTVNFYEGDTFLGSTSLDANSATFSTKAIATVGSHLIRAQYSGDANFDVATSENVSVNIEIAKTTTTLASSANPVFVGAPVTITAQVTGVLPTGSVSFYENGKLLGTSSLQNGTASFDASGLRTVGIHEIMVTYSGDQNNAASSSEKFQQTIKFNPAVLMGILQFLLM